jgi:hypothetical protein
MLRLLSDPPLDLGLIPNIMVGLVLHSITGENNKLDVVLGLAAILATTALYYILSLNDEEYEFPELRGIQLYISSLWLGRMLVMYFFLIHTSASMMVTRFSWELYAFLSTVVQQPSRPLIRPTIGAIIQRCRHSNGTGG